jgi:acyl-CoA reductase-like NAD-dependent aldehyde dehydrogenase
MPEIVNPATGKTIKKRAWDTHEVVERKLNAAAQAFALWRQLGFEQRGAHLKAVAKQLRENKSHHSALMTEEMGKPVKSTMPNTPKPIWPPKP